jgi:hypothetical protein
MTTMVRARPMPHGHASVMLLYGSLLAQLVEFAVYVAAHLPRLVNTFQFVAILGVFIGWLGILLATRTAARRPRRLDEREIAVRDRTAWISFRILGSAVVAVTVGYLLAHDVLNWLPAPGPVELSLVAYTVFVVTATLPTAVQAWTQPSPPREQE